MSELVFNIGNVFSSDGREGVLGKEEAKYFYIAPYQRGYKWASDAPSDPVCLLMSDIKDSFEGKEQEYYLQYITVKKNIQNEYAVLEVIDGQQRLTTLSLLFSVLAYKLKSDDLNFTKNKLKYGIRANV